MPYDAQRVIAAHQAGQSERLREEQNQREAENHKFAIQQKKLELDALKLQAAAHQREIQGMTPGGATGQATVQTPTFQPPTQDVAPSTMSELLQGRRQVAPVPMPIQGMPQSVETGTPPAFPDIPSPMGNLPGTNLEMELQKLALARRQAQMDEINKPVNVPLSDRRMVGGTEVVPATPLPRNIDPNSPEGIAAARAKAATPRVPDYTIGNVRYSGETNKPLVTGPPQASANSTGTNDVKDTAAGIAEGMISPQISQSVSFRDRTAVSAELKRLGYNQAEAERDWKAINKHLSTLNGAQQERLRQAISFTYDTVPQIEAAYAEWKKQAGVSGFKVLNKGNLAAMKQLPGAPGSAATNLEALIADFTSELGTVYKGGNSSTDESLKLAAKNLEGNWNDQTFSDAIKRIRQSLKIRQNSIATSETQGVSADSPYQPGSRATAPQPPFYTLPDGKTVRLQPDGSYK